MPKGKTFRAAYWIDHKGGEIRLTNPEHAHLSDEELVAEARRYAVDTGLDLDPELIEVGDWTE